MESVCAVRLPAVAGPLLISGVNCGHETQSGGPRSNRVGEGDAILPRMKILHLTALHFHQRWFEWAAREANRFDAVAVSGDLLNRNSGIRVDEQIAWVRHWALAFPVPLILASGVSDIDESGRARWLESLARSQLTVDRGRTRLGRWSVEAVPWNRLPANGGEFHIAVAHVGPSGVTPTTLFPENATGGDPRFSRHLRRTPHPPGIILCGSVLCALGWLGRYQGTWVLNPGKGSPHAETPNHIVLELDQAMACWMVSNRCAGKLSLRS